MRVIRRYMLAFIRTATRKTDHAGCYKYSSEVLSLKNIGETLGIQDKDVQMFRESFNHRYSISIEYFPHSRCVHMQREHHSHSDTSARSSAQHMHGPAT